MAVHEPAYQVVQDGLVTVKQAATFLGISVAKTYTLMSRGELPYVKLGRSRRIPRKALVELAAQNLVTDSQDHRRDQGCPNELHLSPTVQTNQRLTEKEKDYE
jgi:excisionase family DNA binding protein